MLCTDESYYNYTDFVNRRKIAYFFNDKAEKSIYFVICYLKFHVPVLVMYQFCSSETKYCITKS